MAFGKLVGFVEYQEQTITEIGDELMVRPSIGLFIRKFHTDDRYYFIPVGKIDSIHDVTEEVADSPEGEDIIEALTAEQIDLFELSEITRKLKYSPLGTAIMKAYLQSAALPTEICQSVVASKHVKIKDKIIIHEPTIQYIDDEYRLSLVVDSDRGTPILCFEFDSKDNKTSVMIPLTKHGFTGYTLPVKKL